MFSIRSWSLLRVLDGRLSISSLVAVETTRIFIIWHYFDPIVIASLWSAVPVSYPAR